MTWQIGRRGHVIQSLHFPNYWPDPKTGIGYRCRSRSRAPDEFPGEVRTFHRSPTGRQIDLRDVPSLPTHGARRIRSLHTCQRMLTLSANISGEDLGRAAAQVQQAISDAGNARSVNVTVRGQIQPMARCSEACDWAPDGCRRHPSGCCRQFQSSAFPSGGSTIPASSPGCTHALLTGRRSTFNPSWAHHGDRRGRGKRHPAGDFRERSRSRAAKPWEAAIEAHGAVCVRS